MLLSALIVFQLIFDVAVVLFVLAAALRRRETSAPPAPPAWHREFVALAQDLLAVTDPLLDLLDEHRSAGSLRPPAPPAPRVRAREAMALLSGGAETEEVARRTGLCIGELRLVQNLLAATAEAGATAAAGASRP